jgi:RND family efflux transporter MFP subunit
MSAKKNQKRVVKQLAILFPLTILGACGCESEAEGNSQTLALEMTRQTREVYIDEIKNEEFRETLELRGTALADKSSALNSEVNGVVSEILVSRGDHVKKGQALVRFEKQSLVLGATQASAAVEAVEAQAKQVVTELKRTKKLVDNGAAPGSAFDKLSSQQEALEAQIRVARAAAGKARKALKDTALRASYDGVVTEIFIERGEMATVVPPKPIIEIVDIKKLQIQAFVPEDSGQLAVMDAEVEVTVKSAGLTTRGAITYVSSKIETGVRSFEIRISIDNSDEKIKADSLARVRVLGPVDPSAILIPIGAVLRDENNEPFVFIAMDSAAHKRKVQLGPTKGARVLVRKGLAAGEHLIVEGAGSLSDEQPIVAKFH